MGQQVVTPTTNVDAHHVDLPGPTTTTAEK